MPNKNGLILIKPTSVTAAGTGSTATISVNGSVEYSSCTSLSLNGVFSADYDNYIFLLRDSGSPTVFYKYRLRSSGTDATGANYTDQSLTGAGTTSLQGRNSNETSARLAYSTIRSGALTTFYGPFLSQPTASRGTHVEHVDYLYLQNFAATHSLSNSYDSLTIFPTAGSCGGKVAMYGMRK
jgi:hypothetical protein